MNPTAQKYGASGFPEVNLVPKEIDQKRIMRVVQVGSVIGVLAVIALVALGYVGALAGKSVANDKLHNAFADEDAALTERNAKADVYTEYATREEQEFALLAVGWGELDYPQLITAILAQDDPETAMISLHVSGPSITTIGGGDVDPILGGGIGRVDFQASARSYEAAIALADRLEAIPGIARVQILSQAFGPDHGRDYWLVNGTAAVTDSYLTRRLVPENGLFPPELWDTFIQGVISASMASDTVETPAPAPEPTASATPSSEEE